MAEKEEKNRQEQELKELHAKVMEADTQDYLEAERRKQEERREINIRHRKELERLMDMQKRSQVVNKDQMSLEESKINKRLLQVVDRTLEIGA
mmetsp:Transcript_52191/g.138255  ORF Transcript_52191/g.138255 Transcript_52191/m.138255 type:complete len:93 (+) Transcript_52191:1380-1658(+)